MFATHNNNTNMLYMERRIYPEALRSKESAIRQLFQRAPAPRSSTINLVELDWRAALLPSTGEAIAAVVQPLRTASARREGLARLRADKA